jgi:hypothetical protein
MKRNEFLLVGDEGCIVTGFEQHCGVKFELVVRPCTRGASGSWTDEGQVLRRVDACTPAVRVICLREGAVYQPVLPKPELL